jgi:hypothetical protein
MITTGKPMSATISFLSNSTVFRIATVCAKLRAQDSLGRFYSAQVFAAIQVKSFFVAAITPDKAI